MKAIDGSCKLYFRNASTAQGWQGPSASSRTHVWHRHAAIFGQRRLNERLKVPRGCSDRATACGCRRRRHSCCGRRIVLSCAKAVMRRCLQLRGSAPCAVALYLISSTVYIGFRVTRTHGTLLVAVNFVDYYGRSLALTAIISNWSDIHTSPTRPLHKLEAHEDTSNHQFITAVRRPP